MKRVSDKRSRASMVIMTGMFFVYLVISVHQSKLDGILVAFGLLIFCFPSKANSRLFSENFFSVDIIEGQLQPFHYFALGLMAAGMTIYLFG